MVLQVLTSASGATDVKKEVVLSIIEDVELVLNGLVSILIKFSRILQWTKFFHLKTFILMTFGLFTLNDVKNNQTEVEFLLPLYSGR